ncbi:MAG: peptidase carboxypeptidase [Candidatus Saccharibacteria bacterium]|nr:peptidase carboxypeptidase [Candidatus Saccharibacteria bacterium]
MSIKQRISFVLHEINQLPRRVTIPIGAALLLVIIYAVAFLIEKPVQFSYAGETCIRQISLFPDLSKQTNDSGFRVEAKDALQVGSVPVLSIKICFEATRAPSVGVSKVSVAPFGGLVARKTFAITVPKAPVARADSLSKPVPIGKPLTVALTAPDTVYGYVLKVDNKTAECSTKASKVQCSLDNLALEQGKDYRMTVVRSFENMAAGTLVSKEVTTLPATNVIKAGLSQDQTIYDRPTAFEFEFDKEVTDASVTLTKVDGATRTPVEQTVQFDKQKASITIAKELDRNSTYELLIDKLTAKDGSTLVQPYTATFKVSVGPKLTSANIKSSGAGLTQTVILTFDQPLSDTQDITKFASVKGVSATITKKDNQVIVSYVGAPKCTDFSISFAKGLESKYQIAQTEPQAFSSRTVCYTVQTIGYSKNGRAIQAYFYGNGGETVLFVGAFHGDERNSKTIMDSWMSELESKARDIPATRQVVVVPMVNPDGIAANRRNNSNNVDLNRNFATSNWQKDITSPINQPIENGGGSTPMSEPETQAIAALTSRLQPRVTVSYHSVAGYAIGNEAGDSGSLAAIYAQLSGYQNMTGNGGAFDYSITGSYEDWIAQKLGLPSLIIELASSTNSEFARNKSALWTMVRS